MPLCKNDATKRYKGDEPSPKGLGYCAHAEKLNTVKIGQDGKKWKVSATKTGVLRWVVDDNIKLLNVLKVIKKWWLGLASGDIMLIYTSGMYKIVSKDTKAKWVLAAEDPDIVAIIWSGMSIDIYEAFVRLLQKNSNSNKALLESPKPLRYIAANYKKFFYKYKYVTNKDYMLKGI